MEEAALALQHFRAKGGNSGTIGDESRITFLRRASKLIGIRARGERLKKP
jgi:hypothetical protein